MPRLRPAIAPGHHSNSLTARFAALVAAAIVGTLSMGQGWAAPPQFPNRPIRLIVGQTAGGNSDFVARTYGQRLAEQFGQQIVIDNRGGASGVIATELVVAAPPDGYTLLLAPTSLAINPSLIAKLSFDTRRDLTPISLLGAGYNILVVSQGNPARSVKDVIAAARAHPGKLTYASSGTASATHLTGELFRVMAGVEMLHVPYKGAPAALTAVISGESDLSFGSLASSLPLIRGGRLRGLAITSRERRPALPDIPTVAESGVPGYESSSWQALLGPARMPPELVERIYREVAASAKAPEVQKRLLAEGLVVMGTTPRELEEHLVRETEKWTKVTKAAGLYVR